MKRILVCFMSVLLALTCVNISPNQAIAAEEGFGAEYFSNMELKGSPDLTRTDATINFDWGLGSPDATIGANYFSVRWTGFINPKYTEKYTFSVTSDDGIRLWIDDQLLIDNWIHHGSTDDQKSIELTAGKQYQIRTEYYEEGNVAIMKLYWSSPSQAKELVPAVVAKKTIVPPTNLVVNGSFETPSVNFVGFEESIQGWKLSAGPTIEIDDQYISKPSEGSQSVELDSYAVSGIYQDIPTEAGKTYKLTFAFKANPKASENKLNVGWGDTVVANLNKTATDTEWEIYTYDRKATSTSTRLSFDNLDETSDGFGTYIDGVSVVETIAADAPCAEGPKSHLIDFNSGDAGADLLHTLAKPISSDGITISFENLHIIKTGDSYSTAGGFYGPVGDNQIIPSDRNNFNGGFLTGLGKVSDAARKDSYRRAINFSQPVNNVCLYIADIDNSKVNVLNSKGESLYSKSLQGKDAGVTTLDWSKLEGVKTIEVIGSGHDGIGMDNLSFN